MRRKHAGAAGGIADAIGLFKEIDDSDGGSGFSFADLAADRAGVRFAEIATGSDDNARKIQSVLAMLPNESYFFPHVTDLPEGITKDDFERFYGGVDNVNYLFLIEKIDKRINKAYSYLETEEAN